MAIKKLLSNIGLSEAERKLLAKAVIISTVVCAAAGGGFWAYKAFPGGIKASPLFSKEAPNGGMILGDLDIEAHEFTARRYLQSGQPEAALPHLRRIAAARRDDRAALDGLARAYLDLGHFERALESVDRLIAAAGDTASADLQVRRGIALYHLKRDDESAEVIRNVLGKDPRNAQALCFMGQIEAANDPRSKAAERFFKRSIESDPNYAEAKYQLARFHENNGDYKSARELLLQTLAAEPLNVRAHARLGMIYYYEMNAEGALKSYQTALALNPHDYNTRYNLGELYRTMYGDSENALREFVLALDGNPNHSEANYKAGLVCIGNGMIKEGIRYFEAALQNDRKDTRRLLQLAAAYERLGDKKKAVSIYEEVTDIDPLHSVALQKIRLLESDA